MADAHAHVGKQPIVKVSKKAAEYEAEASAKERCGNCGHFVEPASCVRVRGEIAKEAYCKLWESKKEHREETPSEEAREAKAGVA